MIGTRIALAFLGSLEFCAVALAQGQPIEHQDQLQDYPSQLNAANPLSTSQNWRADSDGCVGLHLMSVSPAQGVKAPLAGTSQELAAYIKAESAEWRRVVREAKINVD